MFRLLSFCIPLCRKDLSGSKKLSKITFEIFGEVFTKKFENPSKARFFLKCLKSANLEKKPVSVKLAISKYLSNISTNKSKESFGGDIRILNKFQFWLESQKINHLPHIGPEMIDAYQRFLLNSYNISSVNRHFNTL